MNGIHFCQSAAIAQPPESQSHLPERSLHHLVLPCPNQFFSLSQREVVRMAPDQRSWLPSILIGSKEDDESKEGPNAMDHDTAPPLSENGHQNSLDELTSFEPPSIGLLDEMAPYDEEEEIPSLPPSQLGIKSPLKEGSEEFLKPEMPQTFFAPASSPISKEPHFSQPASKPKIPAEEYWTPERNRQLARMVTIHGKKWALITPYFQELSPDQIKSYWTNILEKKLEEPFAAAASSSAAKEKRERSPNAKKPKEAKKPKTTRRQYWNNDANSQLIQLVQMHGENWKKIAEYFPEIEANRIGEHWKNSVNPEFDYGKWCAKDEEKLLQVVSEQTRRKNQTIDWNSIQKSFPKRSGSNLKNRWNSLNRKIQASSSTKE